MGTLQQRLTLGLIESQPGQFTADLEFELPSNLRGFSIGCPPNLRVDRCEGFDEVRPRQYKWNQSTNRPSVSATVETADHRQAAVASTVDTGSWAIVESPHVLTQWRYSGQKPTYSRSVNLSDDGVASSDGGLVYLGPHKEYSRRIAGEQIRLVVPKAASLAESPSRILDALSSVCNSLSVADRDEEVVGIAAPTRPVNWGPGGLQAGASGFWVRDSASLESPNNSWVHEYVHTRQDFDTVPQTKWLIEATAVYFATRYAYLENYIDEKSFYATVNSRMCEDEVLARPRSWSSPHVPYKKGAKVVAWIDAKIQEAGRRGFEEVMWATNTTETPIGWQTLLNLIASAMGEKPDNNQFKQFADQFEKFVQTEQAPPEFIPAGLDSKPSKPTQIGDQDAASLEEALREEFGEIFGTEIVVGGGKVDEGTAFDPASDDSVVSSSDVFSVDTTEESITTSNANGDDGEVSIAQESVPVSTPSTSGQEKEPDEPDVIYLGENKEETENRCPRCSCPIDTGESTYCPNCGWYLRD